MGGLLSFRPTHAGSALVARCKSFMITGEDCVRTTLGTGIQVACARYAGCNQLLWTNPVVSSLPSMTSATSHQLLGFSMT